MLSDILQKTFLGNTLEAYGISLLNIGVGIAIAHLLKRLILRRLKRWAKRTANTLDDQLVRLIERPTLWLLYLGFGYISLQNLTLYPTVAELLTVVGVIFATLLLLQLVGSVAEYSLRIYGFIHRDQPNMRQSLNALIPAVRVFLWAIGIVFVLDNLGFDISAVVTGLGIGGVAIALASQGILQDLFSYFSILLDRPFEIGDFIVVGDMSGTVQQVGIKTTRLQSLDGEQLILANTDLTASRIQNFQRMAQRRIAFNLGVTYETSKTQLELIPDILRHIIEGIPQVTFDRAHFASFGDSSLNYEVVYLVETNDYMVYIDVQQQMNLTIKEQFDKAGIEFAYPTQVLYLNRLNTKP
ncbi:mechanosensitive ion channel family protein [Leptolyngbyaceae cyanobacterium CCMR0082]|uniref:Mechanosensitive ion channel family protein n=2 Tax=Adonisia turfae TaxID=2950184 RepID=A0A6M0SCV3_9CYAN|nr:mechanosensitive ion channel family protein [Adonisia turfae]MDV3352719.1 mechanosensitive ion channel family protein [Leptothoe sp. LEGE 181152]NEZ57003.1 mechanosensitive ion channel family protein [Adonisia turfae CCMR0081]NEZ65883.1 mechanosensitive ion channel family protein [Adonisia turfae CCMR0082]